MRIFKIGLLLKRINANAASEKNIFMVLKKKCHHKLDYDFVKLFILAVNF